VVRLCDVYPDGRSMSVCDGILRARYRDSTERPELLVPGRVYRFEVDLWATAQSFLAGHRIRVEVTSSEEAVRAARAGAGVIMFDNMDAGSIGEAIRELGQGGLRRQVLLEASGGIGAGNLEEYARLDLDRISVGALTHSARALDLSLEIVSRTG